MTTHYKKDHVRRVRNLNIRISAPEYEALEQRASIAGIKLSAYCRAKLLTADSRPHKRQVKNLTSDSVLSSPAVRRNIQLRSPENEKNEAEMARPFENMIAAKSKHRVGCDCEVCVRLRRMIGKRTAQQSSE